MDVKKSSTSRRLTATLALAFLTLSVTVLLIGGSLVIYYNFQTQQEIVAGRQQLIAEKAANTVAGFIQAKFSLLEAVVKLGDPASAARTEQKRLLAKLLGLQPALRQVILLDSQQHEIARISRLSQAASGRILDRIGNEAFSQIKQTNRYIGSVYVDEVTNEPLVVIAVPVTDLFGDVQGTLMAEVNLKFMWDMVHRLKIGEAGLAYVVDRRGNLIAFGDIARVLRGENVAHLQDVDEFIRNAAPADRAGADITSGINGTIVIGTYVPLGTPDWAVVTELPVSEAYRTVVRGILISVVVILVMAMLAGLMGIIVARRLAEPLLNLTNTASRISGGELELQAAIKGPAEVESLAAAFNDMTGQLREMLHKEEGRASKLQHEIIQRRHAEEALRQSEKRYRSIFETASVSLWEEDFSELQAALDGLRSKGVKDFRKYIEAHPEFVLEALQMIKVLDVNKETLKLYGAKDKEELFGSLDKVFVEESLPVFKEEIIALAEGRTDFQAEGINQTLQAERRHVLLRLSVADEKGQANSLLVSIMDLTDRKRAEDELQKYREHLEELVEERTRELEIAQEELVRRERLAVLGQLTATVSHELRNPLGTIRTSNFYLQSKVKAKDSKIIKHLNRIDEQVGLCDSIVNDLLEYTRGRHVDAIQAPINPWLDQLLDEILESEKIEISKHLSRELPPVAYDQEKLRRVIVNVVDNAIQAVNAKKQEWKNKVTAYHPEIQVVTRAGGGGVTMEFADNGIGMDPKTVGRAFEPLFTTRARGTGLGLANVRKIITEHGGYVFIESTPGLGTKVIITLPKVAAI